MQVSESEFYNFQNEIGVCFTALQRQYHVISKGELGEKLFPKFLHHLKVELYSLSELNSSHIFEKFGFSCL